MSTPTELIEGVSIISQYESTYYPEDFAGLVLITIMAFVAFVTFTTVLIVAFINKDGDKEFYITFVLLSIISLIIFIGLFNKAKHTNTYDIMEYKVTISDTAKYNEVNEKLYIIKEDHGVYDIYLKSDIKDDNWILKLDNSFL